MNKTIPRFLDYGISSLSLLDPEIWVHCPQCQKLAKITQDTQQHEQEYTDFFSIYCTQCFYRKKFKSIRSMGHSHISYYQHLEHNLEHWKGACKVSLHKKCLHCKTGKFKFEKHYKRLSNVPQQIEVECNFCRAIQLFPQDQLQIHKAIQSPLGLDPIFHYDLFLTTSVAQGQICVYNPQHLQILKAYIQADLRERTCTNYNKSYFSRLPAWIKSARNRKEILKAILRLEQMSSTMPPLHTFNNSEAPS